jgi:HEPN domain-containing protein
MANKPYAKEWLQFAYRSLLTGKHLFKVGHFTDVIVIDLQQAIEKMLKAILANENRKITKTHNLDELASLILDKIQFNDNEIELLEKITDYYREDRYPNPNYSLPSREETEEILEFTMNLFSKICHLLDISMDEINA